MGTTHDYYGYRMTSDTGFAPCVSNAHMSLACCMVLVRKRAPVNAWIAGWGGARYGPGNLIYLMKVRWERSFQEYFECPQFRQRVDNVYHKVGGAYRQLSTARAHYSLKEQSHDTSVDRVLVATRFVYFGKKKLKVERKKFRDFIPSARMYCVADGGEVDEFAQFVFQHGFGKVGEAHDPLPPRDLVQIL